MKLVNRELRESIDASAARGTAFKELRRLLVYAAILALVVYVAIALVVDLVVARISYETEAKLFQSAQLEKWIPKEQDDPRLADAQSILDKLKTSSEVPPLPYHLLLLEDDSPNAFAFPGGMIGITSGLLDLLTEEIEFTFVLGHELGHFYHRDHLRGIGRAVGVGITFSVIFGGQMGSDSLGDSVRYVLDRGYSRAQEDAADDFGVALVFHTYGKTEGVDRLFQILEESEALPSWAYMFSTHPDPSDRIRNLRTFVYTLVSETNSPAGGA